jgi:hypothetical protein
MASNNPMPRSGGNDNDEGTALASAAGPSTTTMPPKQSSSQRRAHFDASAEEHAHRHEHARSSSEPSLHHFPRLSESTSSLYQAVSSLRETFSESVLDVAPPQVSKTSMGPSSVGVYCLI